MVNIDPFLVFFGSFYIVLGLSLFCTPKAWRDFIKLFQENDAVSLILGIIMLPISLFIIVFYNDWEGTASKILMLIGYLGLFKSLFLLMWPAQMQRIAKNEKLLGPLWLYGILAIGIGGALIVL